MKPIRSNELDFWSNLVSDEFRSKQEDIETEISQIINNKQGPYWNKGHPEHDKTVQQVLTLREMLDGSSK